MRLPARSFFVGLLLIPVHGAAQDAGLLLGVEIRQDSEDFWQPQPQALQTYWIIGNARGAELKAIVPGLLVPQADGFLRAAIERRCGRDPDHGYTFCRDAYWTAGALEQPPAPLSTDALGEEGPCTYETLRVQFLSAEAVAFWRNSGNSEACEPRGWHWTTQTWLQPVSGGAHIRLSEVSGKGAIRAYASAASQAESAAQQDLGVSCEADPEADDRWTVVRRAGAWRPQLAQQNGLGYCDLSADIATPLPHSFTGPDRLALSWAKLAKSIPGLIDAVSSPDGSWSVAITPSELMFVSGKAQNLSRVTTVKSLRLVMAQWALGKHVTRWSTAVSALR